MVNTRVLTSCLLVLLLSLFISSVNASSSSDRAKEKRWEEQIVPGIIVGEPVKLNANGVEFLALYSEPGTDEERGALIILHGIGVHPAWPDVIEPLRMNLPDEGWHTLSLQMPILENEAKDTDYPPLFSEVPLRIQAGVDYLKSKGIKNIAICGHSLGSSMASYYMASHRDPVVKAYVSVSGGPGVPGDTRMDTLENVKKIKDAKILDLYGTDDEKRVLDNIAKRAPIAREVHGESYLLQKIDGANHFYHGKQETLINVVGDWLKVNILQ